MEIQAISPRGYCYGVVNAIKIAKEARVDHPDKDIYILGMIVHNKFIMKALDLLNIVTLDDKETSREDLLDRISNGVVILSAHGSAQAVKQKALDKGLIVYDATCKDVTKTHNLIKDYLNDNYEVIYYGKENHPEAIAALSIDPDHVHLVSNKDDLEKLSFNKKAKIFMTNQTTISILDAKVMFDLAAQLYDDIVITQEICNATRIRQEAILNLDNDVDIVFVVGDPSSNNSNKLAKLAATKNNLDVYMIESIDDIKIDWLANKEKVAVTSGASTPTYLTNMIISFLKEFDYNNKETHLKPQVDLNKILD